MMTWVDLDIFGKVKFAFYAFILQEFMELVEEFVQKLIIQLNK